MLVGLLEVGRVVEVQQFLFNAAREGARQAATGQCTNSQVQAISINYLQYGLNDNAGTMTQNAVITVSDLTTPGTDVSNASALDLIQVTVSVPFQNVRWVNLSLVTTSSTILTSQATWVCLKDSPYPTTAPQPPTG